MACSFERSELANFMLGCAQMGMHPGKVLFAELCSRSMRSVRCMHSMRGSFVAAVDDLDHQQCA